MAILNVGSFEAKTHLPALLERVMKGEIVQITRRGVPVAKLVPVDSDKRAYLKEAAQRIRELRRGIKRGKESVRELIDEGRRY